MYTQPEKQKHKTLITDMANGTDENFNIIKGNKEYLDNQNKRFIQHKIILEKAQEKEKRETNKKTNSL